MRPLVTRTLIATLMLIAPATKDAAVRGYVELPYGPTVCQQETHFIVDACTGVIDLLDDFGAIDMDPYLCRHVTVDGPDVGITCSNVISPATVTSSRAECPIAFEDLWLTEPPATGVNWSRVTCAISYDLVRGSVAEMTGAAAAIDLGAVRCLADDLPQQEWWYVTGPTDPETPARGAAFFYVARAAGVPFGDTTYGRASDGRERIPSEGDCLP